MSRSVCLQMSPSLYMRGCRDPLHLSDGTWLHTALSAVRLLAALLLCIFPFFAVSSPVSIPMRCSSGVRYWCGFGKLELLLEYLFGVIVSGVHWSFPRRLSDRGKMLLAIALSGRWIVSGGSVNLCFE
ncbi:hypothetical protein Tco_0793005 [Tanacetum coccineum]